MKIAGSRIEHIPSFIAAVCVYFLFGSRPGMDRRALFSFAAAAYFFVGFIVELGTRGWISPTLFFPKGRRLQDESATRFRFVLIATLIAMVVAIAAGVYFQSFSAPQGLLR